MGTCCSSSVDPTVANTQIRERKDRLEKDSLLSSDASDLDVIEDEQSTGPGNKRNTNINWSELETSSSFNSIIPNTITIDKYVQLKLSRNALNRLFDNGVFPSLTQKLSTNTESSLSNYFMYEIELCLARAMVCYYLLFINHLLNNGANNQAIKRFKKLLTNSTSNKVTGNLILSNEFEPIQLDLNNFIENETFSKEDISKLKKLVPEISQQFKKLPFNIQLNEFIACYNSLVVIIHNRHSKAHVNTHTQLLVHTRKEWPDLFGSITEDEKDEIVNNNNNDELSDVARFRSIRLKKQIQIVNNSYAKHYQIWLLHCYNDMIKSIAANKNKNNSSGDENTDITKDKDGAKLWNNLTNAQNIKMSLEKFDTY